MSKSPGEAVLDPDAERVRFLPDGPDAPIHSGVLDFLGGGERSAVVLDVACGHGNFTVELARRVGPDGLVVGLDIARRMLERAARRVRDAGVANAVLLRADGLRYRLARGPSAHFVSLDALAATLGAAGSEEVGTELSGPVMDTRGRDAAARRVRRRAPSGPRDSSAPPSRSRGRQGRLAIRGAPGAPAHSPTCASDAARPKSAVQ